MLFLQYVDLQTLFFVYFDVKDDANVRVKSVPRFGGADRSMGREQAAQERAGSCDKRPGYCRAKMWPSPVSYRYRGTYLTLCIVTVDLDAITYRTVPVCPFRYVRLLPLRCGIFFLRFGCRGLRELVDLAA